MTAVDGFVLPPPPPPAPPVPPPPGLEAEWAQENHTHPDVCTPPGLDDLKRCPDRDSGEHSTEEGTTDREASTEGERERTWTEGSTESTGEAPHRPQLVLRGLPFTITEAAVLKFIKSKGVEASDLAGRDAVVLLMERGRPSGFAEIYLAPTADAKRVKQCLHMQYLGGRYVEALPPKADRKVKNVTWRQV